MVRSKQLELVDLGSIGGSSGVKENTDIERGNIVKEMDQNQNPGAGQASSSRP